MFKKGNFYILILFISMILIPTVIISYNNIKASLCEYDIIADFISSINSQKFIIYKESCYWNGIVSIKGAILAPDEIFFYENEDIFKVDPMLLKDKDIGEIKSLHAVWESPNNLSINIDKDVDIKNEKQVYKDIQIKYIRE